MKGLTVYVNEKQSNAAWLTDNIAPNPADTSRPFFSPFGVMHHAFMSRVVQSWRGGAGRGALLTAHHRSVGRLIF